MNRVFGNVLPGADPSGGGRHAATPGGAFTIDAGTDREQSARLRDPFSGRVEVGGEGGTFSDGTPAGPVIGAGDGPEIGDGKVVRGQPVGAGQQDPLSLQRNLQVRSQRQDNRLTAGTPTPGSGFGGARTTAGQPSVRPPDTRQTGSFAGAGRGMGADFGANLAGREEQRLDVFGNTAQRVRNTLTDVAQAGFGGPQSDPVEGPGVTSLLSGGLGSFTADTRRNLQIRQTANLQENTIRNLLAREPVGGGAANSPLLKTPPSVPAAVETPAVSATMTAAQFQYEQMLALVEFADSSGQERFGSVENARGGILMANIGAGNFPIVITPQDAAILGIDPETGAPITARGIAGLENAGMDFQSNYRMDSEGNLRLTTAIQTTNGVAGGYYSSGYLPYGYGGGGGSGRGSGSGGRGAYNSYRWRISIG